MHRQPHDYGRDSIYQTGASSSSTSASAAHPTVQTQSSHHREPREFSSDILLPAAKKRKLDRACDACRKRKSKCDGPQRPDHICSNCAYNNKTCTYLEDSKPRGPTKAYVTGLEDRLEKLEALLLRLRPECNFSEELGPAFIRDSWKEDEPPSTTHRYHPPSDDQTPDSSSHSPEQRASPHGPSKKPSTDSLSITHSQKVRRKDSAKLRSPHIKKEPKDDSLPPDDAGEEGEHDMIDADEMVIRFTEEFATLNLNSSNIAPRNDDNNARFHGKSSGMSIIKATMMFKELHIQELIHSKEHPNPLEMRLNPPSAKRSRFWCIPEFEQKYEEASDTLTIPMLLPKFPPQRLRSKLIDLYFHYVNPLYPALHRPSLERYISANFHHENIWFLCLCFGLFAVASRWCNDDDMSGVGPLYADGQFIDTTERSWRAVGQAYIRIALDIHRFHRSIIRPTGLFEIQTYVLIGVYLRGSGQPSIAWLILSKGVSKALDVGAHRKSVYGSNPTADLELFKRSFWILVMLGRVESAALGRPSVIGEEFYDTEPLLEVDDEHWDSDNPDNAFRQPAEKISSIVAFNLWAELTRLSGVILQTMYATRKTKAFDLWQAAWKYRVLQKINEAMTIWVKSVPDYLKWSPSMDNELFANQSMTMYTSYYYMQILLYRPFTADTPPSSLKPNLPKTAHNEYDSTTIEAFNFLIELYQDISANARAICTNAARSCARMFRSHLERFDTIWDISNLIVIAQCCAATLLVAVYKLKLEQKQYAEEHGAAQASAHVSENEIQCLLKDVAVFCKALEKVSGRWERAAKVLDEIIACLPENPHYPLKERREAENDPPSDPDAMAVSQTSTITSDSGGHEQIHDASGATASSRFEDCECPQDTHARFCPRKPIASSSRVVSNPLVAALVQPEQESWLWQQHSASSHSMASMPGEGGHQDAQADTNPQASSEWRWHDDNTAPARPVSHPANSNEDSIFTDRSDVTHSPQKWSSLAAMAREGVVASPAHLPRNGYTPHHSPPYGTSPQGYSQPVGYYSNAIPSSSQPLQTLVPMQDHSTPPPTGTRWSSIPDAALPLPKKRKSLQSLPRITTQVVQNVSRRSSMQSLHSAASETSAYHHHQQQRRQSRQYQIPPQAQHSPSSHPHTPTEHGGYDRNGHWTGAPVSSSRDVLVDPPYPPQASHPQDSRRPSTGYVGTPPTHTHSPAARQPMQNSYELYRNDPRTAEGNGYPPPLPPLENHAFKFGYNMQHTFTALSDHPRVSLPLSESQSYISHYHPSPEYSHSQFQPMTGTPGPRRPSTSDNDYHQGWTS